MQTTERIGTSSLPMHKFVFMGVGIWVVFVLTFAIAYVRVSNSDNYGGLPFRALTDTETQRPAASYK